MINNSSNIKMLDYIIVGDGIAGLFMYYFLKKAGQKVRLVGHQSPVTASAASTGIINPITGRSYAKTWMAEELLEFSEDFYTTLSIELGEKIIKPVAIYREFEDVRSQNNWTNRSAEASYESFYNDSPSVLDRDKYSEPKSGMEICRSFWINSERVIELLRRGINDNEDYENMTFQHDDLILSDGSVKWNELEAKKLIFAEGYGVKSNPRFNFLPLQYALGQTMVIESPELEQNRIVKKGVFIIPIGGHKYQIGSTFIRNKTELENDHSSRDELKEKLDAALKVPYKVLSYSAGVRTVIKDRRPILGPSMESDSIYIFNGLGTKGYSLGPYFANHLVEHLISGIDILSEVSVERFYS